MASPETAKPATARRGEPVSNSERLGSGLVQSNTLKASEAQAILAQNADAIRALGKRVIGDVIEIGRRLSESKKLCGHGNWLPWLERELGWKEQNARDLMALY